MTPAPNTCGIARIVRHDTEGCAGEKHIGMAFVIDPQHVMTCCHVLNDALRRPDRSDRTQPLSDSGIAVRFPFSDNARGAGKVVRWGLSLPWPVDVAVLRLERPAPTAAGVAVFSDSEVRGDKWSCFGCDENGVERETRGEFASLLSREQRQLNGPDGVAPRIVGGYSGAPVWAEGLKAFVGMVVTKDRDHAENWLAYAIPTGVLVEVWPELRRGKCTALPSLQGTGGPFMDVPRDLPHFTGRTEELRELERHLLGTPKQPVVVCNVTGLGGVGKSKLAARFAALHASSFPGGVFWAEVDHKTPKEVALSIARVLGKEVGSVDDEHAKWLIQRLFGGRQALLILDNADGPAAAGRIINILPNENTVAVLITTRNRRLSVDLDLGTVSIEVKEFTNAEGIALFRNVLANDPRLEKDEAILHQILEFVGRLPLLIDLLASFLKRRPGLRFADLYDSLRQSRPIPSWPKNQSTVADIVIGKSTEELPPHELEAFVALGACGASGFSRSAAMAASGIGTVAETIALLDRLIDLSLVQDLSGERFKLHPVVRACVRTKKGIDAADRRHAGHWRLYVNKYQRDSAEDWVNLTSEWDGIRCAWDFCLSPVAPESGNSSQVAGSDQDLDRVAAEMAGALRYFLDGRGFWQEAVDRMLPSLAAAKRIGDVERCFRIGRHLALLLRKLRRFVEAAGQNLVNIRAASDAGRRDWLGEELEQLGRVRVRQGQHDEAEALYLAALALAASNGGGGRRYEGQALNCLGELHRQQKAYDQAIDYFKRVLKLYEESDDVQGICATLSHLGATHYDMGEAQVAVRYYSRALKRFHEVGRVEVEGSLYQNLGLALESLGRRVEAVACFLLSADISDRLGVPGWRGVVPGKERDRLLQSLGQEADRYRTQKKSNSENILTLARVDVTTFLASLQDNPRGPCVNTSNE
jgi:tetratricopeptide (TPR) repeat protein